MPRDVQKRRRRLRFPYAPFPCPKFPEEEEFPFPFRVLPARRAITDRAEGVTRKGGFRSFARDEEKTRGGRRVRGSGELREFRPGRPILKKRGEERT